MRETPKVTLLASSQMEVTTLAGDNNNFLIRGVNGFLTSVTIDFLRRCLETVYR